MRRSNSYAFSAACPQQVPTRGPLLLMVALLLAGISPTHAQRGGHGGGFGGAGGGFRGGGLGAGTGFHGGGFAPHAGGAVGHPGNFATRPGNAFPSRSGSGFGSRPGGIYTSRPPFAASGLRYPPGRPGYGRVPYGFRGYPYRVGRFGPGFSFGYGGYGFPWFPGAGYVPYPGLLSFDFLDWNADDPFGYGTYGYGSAYADPGTQLYGNGQVGQGSVYPDITDQYRPTPDAVAAYGGEAPGDAHVYPPGLSSDPASAPYPVPENDAAGAVQPSPLIPYRAEGSAPAPQEALIVVFRDGRPPEQVRNYALTRTALLITGPHLREIPLEEIDLPATQRANRALGIDFRLPE